MANPRTILTLLTLTAFTRTTTASLTLSNEVFKLPDYPYLTSCQQKCIAGEPNNQAYLTSVLYLSNCDTKACFCPPQNEPQIGQQVQTCLEGVSGGVCATTLEYNGVMAFVAKYCGFDYVPARTGLLFPTSGGWEAATSTLGATTSCWDIYGYPVETAECSSTMSTATRTSYPYWTSTSTAGAQTTDTSVGGKGRGGFGIGKIIGFSILGLFVSAIMGALGCGCMCPGVCCCC